jgi:hypothetical protein
VEPPLSDSLTYSVTSNREQALDILAAATTVLVISGDAVP